MHIWSKMLTLPEHSALEIKIIVFLSLKCCFIHNKHVTLHEIKLKSMCCSSLLSDQKQMYNWHAKCAKMVWPALHHNVHIIVHYMAIWLASELKLIGIAGYTVFHKNIYKKHGFLRKTRFRRSQFAKCRNPYRVIGYRGIPPRYSSTNSLLFAMDMYV